MVNLHNTLVAEIVYLSPHIAISNQQAFCQQGLRSCKITSYPALFHLHILYIVCESHVARNVAPLYRVILHFLSTGQSTVNFYTFNMQTVNDIIGLTNIDVSVNGGYGCVRFRILLEARTVYSQGLFYVYRIKRTFTQGYHIVIDSGRVG